MRGTWRLVLAVAIVGMTPAAASGAAKNASAAMLRLADLPDGWSQSKPDNSKAPHKCVSWTEKVKDKAVSSARVEFDQSSTKLTQVVAVHKDGASAARALDALRQLLAKCESYSYRVDGQKVDVEVGALKITLKQSVAEKIAIRQSIKVGGMDLEQDAVAYRQGTTVGFVTLGGYYVDIDQFRGLV